MQAPDETPSEEKPSEASQTEPSQTGNEPSQTEASQTGSEASLAVTTSQPVVAVAVKPMRPKVILVTDSTYSDDRIAEVVEACARALPKGEFAVQLRDRKKEDGPLRAFAERLRAVTKEHGALFFVNGHPQLAKDVGADGVHLGGTAIKVPQARAIFGAAGEAAFVTIAAHSDQAVKLGAKDGADGALVSAIFASPGKAEGRGVDALRTARVSAPKGFAIYALGGVDKTNSGDCFLAGADGVALIRALLLASDPAAEARAIHESLKAI